MIEFQIKRLCNLANAIIASQQLLQTTLYPQQSAPSNAFLEKPGGVEGQSTQ
jgi:hypothetical protein